MWMTHEGGMLTGNSALLAHDVRAVVGCEMLVQHTIQTACFVLVAVHAVFDVLGSVAGEMVCVRFSR